MIFHFTCLNNYESKISKQKGSLQAETKKRKMNWSLKKKEKIYENEAKVSAVLECYKNTNLSMNKLVQISKCK